MQLERIPAISGSFKRVLVKRVFRMMFVVADILVDKGKPAFPRKSFDNMGKVAKGIKLEQDNIAGMHAEWAKPIGEYDATKVVLYLHGGGFVIGSTKSHRTIVSVMAKYSNTQVLNFNYRLAPESQYPAPIEDAIAVYEALFERGFKPENIVFAGESAGGAMVLDVLMHLRDQGKPLPAAGIPICPWVDYECKQQSLLSKNDTVLSERIVRAYQRHTFAGQEAEYNLMKKDFSGLPPLLLQIGGMDLLYDDGLIATEKLKEAGNTGRAEVWEGMPHVPHGFYGIFPEAVSIQKSIASFLQEHLK